MLTNLYSAIATAKGSDGPTINLENGLVDSVWAQWGTVFMFVVIMGLVLKYGMGREKNIPKGLLVLLGIAGLLVLALNGQWVVDFMKGMLGFMFTGI